MWILNTDTGKWTNQIDTLSKDNYDNLKQDLQSVRLYSKCLSGSTYLPINNFNDIYDVLHIDRVGYYVTDHPSNGPITLVDSSNSSDFYSKYLTENAFTLKNLFTPNKLINSQLNNYVYVDICSTPNDIINSIGSTQIGLAIDGVSLIEGHRVLIKDQITQVTLSSSYDPSVYFSNIGGGGYVANYYLLEDDGTEATYYYYNSQNGIYKFVNNILVREPDLDTYT